MYLATFRKSHIKFNGRKKMSQVTTRLAVADSDSYFDSVVSKHLLAKSKQITSTHVQIFKLYTRGNSTKRMYYCLNTLLQLSNRSKNLFEVKCANVFGLFRQQSQTKYDFSKITIQNKSY